MEARLFDPASPPEWTTPEWYSTRDRAPHLEEAPHQWRLFTAREFIVQAVLDYNIKSVSDLGAGDGGLLSTLFSVPVTTWGYDLQPSNIRGAQQRGPVAVSLRNVLTDDIKYGDLSVATEMIEHLVDPHSFVRSIPSRFLVASSPVNETVDSAYLFHTWCWDREGYAALLEQGGYEIVEHADNGQFQCALARRP